MMCGLVMTGLHASSIVQTEQPIPQNSVRKFAFEIMQQLIQLKIFGNAGDLIRKLIQEKHVELDDVINALCQII